MFKTSMLVLLGLIYILMMRCRDDFNEDVINKLDIESTY